MFLEQDRQKGNQVTGPMSLGADEDPFRWVFLSDVCKHCEEAGCLEACPTGSIVRTEVGSVLVQNDVCNGCGYCVVSCPFGVIDRRPAAAATMPAAHSSARFVTIDKRAGSFRPVPKFARPNRLCSAGSMICARAATERVQQLQQSGYNDAQLYDPTETSVRGIHAFFLILGEPEAYGLPRSRRFQRSI